MTDVAGTRNEPSRTQTTLQVDVLLRELDTARAMLGNTEAQIAYLDRHLNFLDVSPAYCAGCGYSRQQLLGRNHFELFPNLDNQAIFERVLNTGEPTAFRAKPFVFAGRPELGTTYWDWTLAPHRDVEGRVQGLVLSLIDVTDRERAKQRGRAHLAQLETLLRAAQQVLRATTNEDVHQATAQAQHELAALASSVPADPHAAPETEAIRAQLAALESLGQEHLRSRDEAQRQTAQLESLISVIPAGILVYDALGRIVRANAAAQAITGFTPETAKLPLRQRLASLKVTDEQGEPMPPDSAPTMRALRGETVRDVMLSFQHSAAPAPIWCYACAAPIDDPDGTQVGAVATLMDIGELRAAKQQTEKTNEKLRRQSEELLRNYQQLGRLTQELQAEHYRLKTVVDNSPAGIVLADKKARIVMANPAADRLLEQALPVGKRYGKDAARLLYYPDDTAYNPTDLPLTRAALDGLTLSGVDIAIQRPDGRKRVLRTDSAPIRDAQGKLLGAVGIFSDSTESREAAETIARYAQRLRILHEADQAILAGQSAEEIAVAALPYIQQLVPCERIGISLFDLDRRQVNLLAVAARSDTVMPKGWTGPLSETPWPGVLVQGTVRVVDDLASQDPLAPFDQTLVAEGIRSWTNVPLIVEGKLLGALNLGTGQPGKLAAEQMEILREMADELAVGLQQAALRHQIQRHSEELEKHVQERTAKLRSSQGRLQAIFDGAPIGVALLNRQGQILDSNVMLAKLLSYPAEELRGMSLGQLALPEDTHIHPASPEAWDKSVEGNYRQTLRLLRNDGQLLWANVTVSRLTWRDEEGAHALAMVEDVTRARQTQEELIQSEKLAIAGRLAASLAHEINNPLQSVIGCLSLVEEACARHEDFARYLQVARDELKRAAGITARLRDVYSPSNPQDRQPTDLNALIERVLTLTKKRCEDSGVKVAWKPGKLLPLLKLAPGSIQQVFLNLVLNAVEAMPSGGRLSVKSARSRKPSGIGITLSDNAGGIPPEVLSHLFEPFRTSKADGLGLGLYITQRIIEDHGGHISVQTRAGVGSTFRIWLPA